MAMKSDSAIQEEVLRELRWDPRLGEAEVGVEVDRGIVTLTGTVESWPKRLAAQEAAHRVVGVRDVANDVEVRLPGGSQPSDTEIARNVRRALEWDVLVPHERIQSTVSKGIVTLQGMVESWTQREDATRAVQNLIGVRGVADHMTVAPTTRVEPEKVRLAIENALERRAEREAKRIQVEVTGAGTVKLVGRVRSWDEKRATLAAARFTRGVRAVEDALQIEPWS
jgi:osmotically-inducible protein OsmY